MLFVLINKDDGESWRET